MKYALGLFCAATLFTGSARAESGHDNPNAHRDFSQFFVSAQGALIEVSCKGQGSRCSNTEECCELNDCMVGDHSYPTCGGG